MGHNNFAGINGFRKGYIGGEVGIKDSHTIIDKWPLRLKLEHGQPGAQEEFELLQQSEHEGVERYVEWKRIG
jgi:hypothetical protein